MDNTITNKCGNETPRITVEEAYELYRENQVFRNYVDTEAFRINALGIFPYIQLRSADGNGCLVFDKDADPNGQCKKSFYDTPENSELRRRTEYYLEQYRKIHDRQADKFESANEMMLHYMKEAKWNTTIFQEKTLLSPNDYSRLKDPKHNFKLPAYVAMAVGLNLSKSEFQEIIKKAGLCLVDGDEVHDAYSFLLTLMIDHDIDECNDFLEKLGIEKLGTHSRE